MNIKYINIPSVILFDSHIPALAKLLYGELKVLSYKNDVCEVSNRFLAKHNNCSPKTITRMLKVLKERNYIEIIDECISRKIKVN